MQVHLHRGGIFKEDGIFKVASLKAYLQRRIFKVASSKAHLQRGHILLIFRAPGGIFKGVGGTAPGASSAHLCSSHRKNLIEQLLKMFFVIQWVYTHLIITLLVIIIITIIKIRPNYSNLSDVRFFFNFSMFIIYASDWFIDYMVFYGLQKKSCSSLPSTL